MKFITILCTRSATHLMRVFEEYEKIANKSIEDSIKSETHGSLEEAMLTVESDVANHTLQFGGIWLLIRETHGQSEIDLNLIKHQFNKMYGKTLSSMIMDLTETLKSELSGKFERLIIALMYPPYSYEAKELYDAMKGLGTKEGVIIEILASRTKNQLREIMKAYEEGKGPAEREGAGPRVKG
ncbi:Annexin A8 [Camelus dromedarius]|uniref:Annexin A8 n=1 Tax=Camelus dromedarius TaxID=9838 RepID=A0A5N4DJP2_CAMDR|nr:Annexin A8 [Camelus dromedarius]